MPDNTTAESPNRSTQASVMDVPIGARAAGGSPFDRAFANAPATFAGPDSLIGATPAPLISVIINRERAQVQQLMVLHEEVCTLLFAMAGESVVGDNAMKPMASTAETLYKGDPPAIGAFGELAVLGSEQDKIIQCIRQTMTAFQAYI